MSCTQLDKSHVRMLPVVYGQTRELDEIYSTGILARLKTFKCLLVVAHSICNLNDKIIARNFNNKTDRLDKKH